MKIPVLQPAEVVVMRVYGIPSVICRYLVDTKVFSIPVTVSDLNTSVFFVFLYTQNYSVEAGTRVLHNETYYNNLWS